VYPALLPILVKSIPIAIAILGGKSIAILIAIPFSKSFLSYWNTIAVQTNIKQA